VPPLPSFAQITIESSVANADVYIDEKFAGNVPLPNYRVLAGTHVIEIRAAGYAPWKREISIAEGGATRVMAQLDKTRD
jgi:hypothetical protein